MKYTWINLSLVLSLLLSPIAIADTSDAESLRVRQRLNQLFYWRLADELKLSTAQEKSMAELLGKIQSEREEAYRARMEILAQLKDTKNPLKSAELKKKMDEMQMHLKKLSQLDLQEHTELRKILGDESLGRFYVIREETVDKIRSAIKK